MFRELKNSLFGWPDYTLVFFTVGHNHKPQARKPFLGVPKVVLSPCPPAQACSISLLYSGSWLTPSNSHLRLGRKWITGSLAVFLRALSDVFSVPGQRLQMTFSPWLRKQHFPDVIFDQCLNPDTWWETPSPNYWTTRNFKIALTLPGCMPFRSIRIIFICFQFHWMSTWVDF